MINSKAPFQASILATAILLTACGGDSSSSNSSSASSLGFSSQAANNAVISAVGGDSASQQGGHGGSITIGQTNSPAALNILTAGIPDTSYQLPTTSAQLGSVPVTIAEDTDVEILSDVRSSTDAGTLYMSAEKNRLYQHDGVSDFEARNCEVTGLVINAGATLIIEGNSGDNVVLFFANDLVNNGTIETLVASRASSANEQRASISLHPAAYSGTGSIKTEGVYPSQSAGSITISAMSITNSGDFFVNGEDGEENGENGGQGGDINLTASTFIENKGKLNTSGGFSEVDTAGSAGSVTVTAAEIYNSGKILAESGEGENPTKPDASQSIRLSAHEVLINSGDLSVNGSDSIEDGYATDAGSIFLSLAGDVATRSQNRRLINSANLTANGGNTVTTNHNQMAGQGGHIEISATEGENDGATASTESLVIIAGNLLANGGNSDQEFVDNNTETLTGSDAGDAGNIVIEHNSNLSHKLPTYLSGYASIQVDGGEGLQAGDAGSVDITNRKTSDETTSLAGPITVESNISADAGLSISSDSDNTPSAGDGGEIDIQVVQDQAYLQAGELTISLTGNATANASDVENGHMGAAKSIKLNAPHGIIASADLSANGSSVTEAEDHNELFDKGSDGGLISLSSYEGNISYSGNVTANGGHGLLEGGDAGGFSSISSASNSVAGTITLNGGNATSESETDTHGGDAGVAYIYSDDYSASLTASITTLAGNGVDAGREGGAIVNADCQVGTCNDKDEDLVN